MIQWINLAKKSGASKGSIHGFCTSLVNAKIATQDKSTKKYSIKIDDEKRNNILEYFYWS